MERHSELKIRYDPEIGRYVKKHVYTGRNTWQRIDGYFQINWKQAFW